MGIGVCNRSRRTVKDPIDPLKNPSGSNPLALGSCGLAPLLFLDPNMQPLIFRMPQNKSLAKPKANRRRKEPPQVLEQHAQAKVQADIGAN